MPTFYFYWLLGRKGKKKKNGNKRGRAQPPAVKTDIPTRGKKEGWGQSSSWWWGVFWMRRGADA